MTGKASLSKALDRFPRVRMTHAPTPVESLNNLSSDLGLRLSIKRDDCTGIGFGGNKVRQLEFYLGQACEQHADTVLITGAVQSNFVRTTAAMAAKLGMACHVQLEDRVATDSEHYRSSGNVLLNRLLGASVHHYGVGEDESGADAALDDLAGRLSQSGASPYVIHLGMQHPPLGALGYVSAAMEIADQLQTMDRVDVILHSIRQRADTHRCVVRAAHARYRHTGAWCLRASIKIFTAQKSGNAFERAG